MSKLAATAVLLLFSVCLIQWATVDARLTTSSTHLQSILDAANEVQMRTMTKAIPKYSTYRRGVVRPFPTEIPTHIIFNWEASQFIQDARTYFTGKAAGQQPQAAGTLAGYEPWLDALATFMGPPPGARKGKIAVMGGGPTGLTAALFALKGGFSVDLFEKRCSYTRMHIVNTHKINSQVTIGGKGDVAYGMSQVLGDLGFASIIGTEQAKGKIFQFLEPIDTTTPIDYKVVISDLEFLLLAAYLITKDAGSTFGPTAAQPACLLDPDFPTILANAHGHWKTHVDTIETTHPHLWHYSNPRGAPVADPLVPVGSVNKDTVAVIHAEGARSTAAAQMADKTMTPCSGFTAPKPVKEKCKTIRDYWVPPRVGDPTNVAPITFEFVYASAESDCPSVLNQNDHVARMFSKYHSRRKLCLLEIHLKREFGLELLKFVPDGFRWPLPNSAQAEGEKVALLYYLLLGFGADAKLPLEAKIWQSPYGLTINTDNQPVVGAWVEHPDPSKKFKLYHYLIGDAARGAYPDFAMGVNDGASLAKLAIESVAKFPTKPLDACKDYDGSVREAETDLVSKILEKVGTGAPKSNNPIANNMAICTHLTFVNAATAHDFDINYN